MTKFDEQYLSLVARILESGEVITTNPNVLKAQLKDSNMPTHLAQTEVPTTTYSLPHEVLEFDLGSEFPILTTKRVAFKTAVLEILWIHQAMSNKVSWLHDRGIKIWDEWEIPENGIYAGKNYKKLYKEKGLSESPVGTIGTAYGWIVNRYRLTESLIETLKSDPANRRMVMSLWQNEWLPTAALPSCVWNSQWNLIDGRLNLLVTSRSSDVPLGLPFNVVQYAVLCHLIAHVIGARPGQFTFITNDAHIYENQIDGIKEQIERYDEAVKTSTLPPAPKLWINPEIKDFHAFDSSRALKDIKLENYQNLGTISMPVTE